MCPETGRLQLAGMRYDLVPGARDFARPPLVYPMARRVI